MLITFMIISADYFIKDCAAFIDKVSLITDETYSTGETGLHFKIFTIAFL